MQFNIFYTSIPEDLLEASINLDKTDCIITDEVNNIIKQAPKPILFDKGSM